MSEKNEQKEDAGLVSRFGPIEIDWPRSIGYFGGIALAVALDLVAPPLALFVAAVPFLKLLKRPRAGLVERAGAAVLEGMAKPIGGDSEGTVRLADEEEEKEPEKANGAAAPEKKANGAAAPEKAAAPPRPARPAQERRARPNGDSSKRRSRSAASS